MLTGLRSLRTSVSRYHLSGGVYQLEKLREFSKREQIDLLLVGDSVAEKELEGIQALQTVRLSETGIAKEGEAVVYKYQPRTVSCGK